jgi:putative transposase
MNCCAAFTASFGRFDWTYGTRRVWHDVLSESFEFGLHGIERLIK